MLKWKCEFIVDNFRHVCQRRLVLLAIAVFTGVAGTAKANDDFETITEACLEEGVTSADVAERLSARDWAGVSPHSLANYADLYGDWVVLRGVLVEGVPSLPQEDLRTLFNNARHEIVTRDTFGIWIMKLADDATTNPAFNSIHYLHDSTGLIWLEALEDVRGLTCRLYVANSAADRFRAPKQPETLETPYEDYVRVSGTQDAGRKSIVIFEFVSDGYSALTGVPPNLSWVAEIKRLDRE